MAKKGKKHIITSVIEHHAVLHTTEYLEKQGFEVTYIPVDDKGLINAEDVRNAIREDTALVTIMYANNEIGTIQPIDEIAAICKEKKVLFHTDAVQAVGHVEIDVHKQGIDMLSLSGHKIHAQKGIGALYIRKGVALPNLIHGGGQERRKRAGTENVPAIVGLGAAMEIACSNIAEKAEIVTEKRNRIIDGLLTIPYTRLNGDRDKRLPGNVNISFEGIEGESLLLMLDMYGICASSGSACTSGSLDPSHVLLSIGLKHEIAHGSLRLSIEENITDTIDYEEAAKRAYFMDCADAARGQRIDWTSTTSNGVVSNIKEDVKSVNLFVKMKNGYPCARVAVKNSSATCYDALSGTGVKGVLVGRKFEKNKKILCTEYLLKQFYRDL